MDVALPAVIMEELQVSVFSACRVTTQPLHLHVMLSEVDFSDHTQCTATSTSFLDHFSRTSQLHTTQHAPCDILYFVPTLIGC